MLRSIFGAVAISGLASTTYAQAPAPIKVGVLNDQSGIYADLAGPGSVIAARLAVDPRWHRPSSRASGSSLRPPSAPSHARGCYSDRSRRAPGR